MSDPVEIKVTFSFSPELEHQIERFLELMTTAQHCHEEDEDGKED